MTINENEFLTKEQLASIMPELPHDKLNKTLTKLTQTNTELLDLSDTYLDSITTNGLETLLPHLKQDSIKSIDLSLNQMEDWTLDHWQLLFSYIQQSNITSINLNENHIELSARTNGWEFLFNGLGEKITSIHLSHSGMRALGLEKELKENVTTSRWKIFFDALKNSNIESLDLSYNDLNLSTSFGWQEFCSGLKESKIKSLDLSANHFYKLTPTQWNELFSSLKDSTIKSLNLSDSRFNSKMEIEQWQAFCNGLKDSTIESLDLSINSLDKLTEDRWNILIDALKNSKIANIDFGIETIRKLSDERKQDLINISNVKIANSEYLAPSTDDFLKAIQDNKTDIITKYLDGLSVINKPELFKHKTITTQVMEKILETNDRAALVNEDAPILKIIFNKKEQVTTEELKSIVLIAGKFNKNEIVNTVEEILKTRENLAKDQPNQSTRYTNNVTNSRDTTSKQTNSR
jgi:hypothetical protein